MRRDREATWKRSTPTTSTCLPPRLLVLLSVFTANVVLASPAVAAAGDLDTSFGGDGKVTTDFGGSGGASEVAIQPDGKIVAAGSAGGDFALARYHRDGSLDTSFDGDGKVTTDFGGSGGAAGVAIQPDGKIVAAGSAGGDFALARYHRDGSLDTSFDGDGRVTTDFGGVLEVATGVAIQPNGKIVAAGPTGAVDDFALARYNRDGSLDTSFDGDGKVTTDFGSSFEAALGVAIRPNGEIVAVGFGGATDDFALARYNRDGSLDTSFDGDGKVTTDFGFIGPFGDPVHTIDVATGVAIQSNGNIVAAGSRLGFGYEFAMARYNGDGSLDTDFGFGGKVTTNGELDNAFGVAIQLDGKIVAAGTPTGFGEDGPSWALARYNRDGSLDTSFDGDGQVTTDFEGAGESANGVTIQPNGRIVVAGSGGAGFGFALARYLGR